VKVWSVRTRLSVDDDHADESRGPPGAAPAIQRDRKGLRPGTEAKELTPCEVEAILHREVLEGAPIMGCLAEAVPVDDHGATTLPALPC
jgi:hypothetical protein